SNHTGSVVRWERSSDAAFTSPTNIDNTTTTLSGSAIGNLSADTWFRAIVKSGVCDAVASSAVKITVGAVPVKPEFTITQPNLCGPSTGTLTICQSVSGFNYTVGNVTKPGNGSSLSFTELAAGSNPSLSITNTVGSCPSGPFSCNDAVDACTPVGETHRMLSRNTQLTAEESQLKLTAYPNPFNDKINFVINSSLSGKGSLEVYNALGQKIKTVYQGTINKGTQSFELRMPVRQQANLVYVLRVGDKQLTGKILQLNR
ncbi:MAG TPA: T9SS type A sorting domain-containing protein, partial [Flavisolibacter sp.]|nr:T9SS type A sorting domain-containing protein [Flavisolibacter sp.]